jgi:hypothetical protein
VRSAKVGATNVGSTNGDLTITGPITVFRRLVRRNGKLAD